MPIIYSPPYDSPIEDDFMKCFSKYSGESARLFVQHEVSTLCGNFILDFCLQTDCGRTVAVECDGKEFHDESRDEWRDGMILGEVHVDVIYRFTGADIVRRIEDVMYFFVRMEPKLFGERARRNLSVLASDDIKTYLAEIESEEGARIESYTFQYKNDFDRGRFRAIKRSAKVTLGKRCFWQAAYNHALKVGGGSLDDVISDYRSRSEF